MDFKSLLSQLDQLNEAVEKTKTGIKHTAEPGGYGRKDDEDEEGNKVKSDAPKKGRGRPKKDADASGEVKSYDTKSLGSVFGGGKAPKKPVGKVSAKHSLKEYFDSLDKAMNEAEQIEIKPASQTQTQVIQKGGKTLGTVNNPQLAQQIKQSIGKGEMSLGADAGMNEEDIGKHNNATTGFDALVKKLTPKYGVEAAKRIAGAQLKKIKEADLPSDDSDMGAGLGAGRSQGVLEGRTKADNKAEKAGKKVTKDLEYDMGHKGKDDKKAEKAGKKVTKDIEYDEKKKVKEDKKPDANKNGIPDYAEDGKGKNDLKKKKVKESMDHRLKAAHHRGKAHALAKESYNCKYDDMEEARMYHEGFKEGLDECYGQMPIQGYVGETDQTTVDDMASFGAHTPEMDEGNAFTAKLKATPAGGEFTLGGKKFHDTSALEETGMFESWDNQLSSLLEEYQEIQEGLTVSISKGQQGAPDSVSVNAQDGEAEQLLQFIKQAGLGIFGGEEQTQTGSSSPMSLAVDGEPETASIGVVDDHDGMMNLIKKVTGGHDHAGPEHGFEISTDEEGHDHDHADEESCNECGMMETDCDCDDGKEVVDEVESEDQMTYEVAEDNAPDSDEAETTADENAEAAEDQALATADEEQVDEAYANGADDTFEADIDFMTKVISGGLNKQKSTGQTTIPVVASQLKRQVAESADNVRDWKKLAGIK